MKKLVVFGVLLLLTCVLVVAGCSSSSKSTTPSRTVSTAPVVPASELLGTWMSQRLPEDTIILRANDTFDMTKGGTKTSGSYVVKGNQLMFSAGSFNDGFMISADGKTLIEADGSVWVKSTSGSGK